MEVPINKKSSVKKGAIFGFLYFIFAKLKWILAILKFSKFGLTLISMVVSLAAYAAFYGWKFAVALTYLILVHEYGHLLAAKIKGIKTTPAVFIPFVGALISLKEQPRDAKTEAFLAYGGPLAGLVSFLPAVALYATTQNPFWALVISLGAMINLFNLVPVHPLDGGRIVTVLPIGIWFVGLVIFGVMLFFSPSPIMFLILLFGFTSCWKRMRITFQVKKLDEKIHIIEQIIDEYDEIKISLFDSEGNLVSNCTEVAKSYALRSEKRISQIDERLNQFPKFLVPVFQDKKILEKSSLSFEKEQESIRTFFLSSEKEVEGRQGFYQTVIQTLENMKPDVKYYDVDKKTRWSVLGAYLALVLVLSGFMMYAMDIMHGAKLQ